MMVDCHWRFDEAGARRVMRDLAPARLYWLECPVSENPDAFALLQRIHAETRALGMQLAVAKRQVGLGGFAPFVHDRLLDVVMPDIKYAGGYAEMLRIAERCAQRGVHNGSSSTIKIVSGIMKPAPPAAAHGKRATRV